MNNCSQRRICLRRFGAQRQEVEKRSASDRCTGRRLCVDCAGSSNGRRLGPSGFSSIRREGIILHAGYLGRGRGFCLGPAVSRGETRGLDRRRPCNTAAEQQAYFCSRPIGTSSSLAQVGNGELVASWMKGPSRSRLGIRYSAAKILFRLDWDGSGQTKKQQIVVDERKKIEAKDRAAGKS